MTTPGRRRVIPRAAIALALGVCLAFGAALSARAQQVATTDEVKAAFLINFAKFVEWPSDAASGTTFTLGVLGSDGIAEELRELVRGKAIGPRQIVVRRLTADEDPSKLHLLFIGQAEKSRLPDLMRRLERTPVLTVSDGERFCEQGGVIALTLEDNHVRFEISLHAAQRSRLKISSKLLTLARKIHPVMPEPTGER